MLELICGIAGSGKSTRIEEMIAQDVASSRRAYLIVPEQETVTVERSMADILPPRAALSFEVVNFSRLCNLVFRKYGSLAYHYASSRVKTLTMWRALSLCEGHLQHFSGISENGGVKKILSAVKAFGASGANMTQVASAAEKLDASLHLSKKLKDIALVGSVYHGLLEEKYDDSEQDLDRLANLLSEHSFFEGAHVYIDSFTSFTGQELTVIAEILKQCDRLCISLLCDRVVGEQMHFQEVYKTASRLLEIADRYKQEHSVTTLSKNLRARSPSLCFAAEHLWSNRAEKCDCDDGAISELVCDDPFDEAEKIAADIMAKVRAGARFSDIGVVYREASSYSGIIDIALRDAGIPYFLSEQSDAEAKPLIKLIESAMQIHTRSWRRKDIVSYVKTGLLGLGEDETDMFELYASRWNINGKAAFAREWTANPDGYSERVSACAEQQLFSANSVRERIVSPLLTLFSVFTPECTVSQATEALTAFLAELDIENVISERAKSLASDGRIDDASELVRLWNLMVSALEEMTDTVGETRVDASKYLQMLRLLFEDISIGTLPRSIDSVVVGSANLLRSQNLRHVYIAGLCEGEFPRGQTDTSLFSFSELEKLEELGILSGESEDIRSSSELLYFYRAFCASAETVTLSAPKLSASGDEKSPSLALLRARKLFENIKTVSLAGEELIISDKALLSHYSDGDAIFKNACKIVAERRGISLPSAQQRTLVNSDVRVSKAVAQNILRERPKLSFSRLDSYSQCPFNYYCRYVLGLKEDYRIVFGANDVGNFVHAIMEEFLKEVVQGGGDFAAISDDKCAEMADRIIKEYLKGICRGEPDHKIASLAARMRRLVLVVIKNLKDEFAQSDFVPRFFELDIANRELLHPFEFELSDGDKISLNGRIDRVDVLSRNGKNYVRVVDYKSSKKTIKVEDIEDGNNLQMLIYLFAVVGGSKKKFVDAIGSEGEVLPAGVLYFSNFSRQVKSSSGVESIDDAMKLAQSNLSRSGLLLDDEQILRAMEKDLEGKYIPYVIARSGNQKNDSVLVSFDRLKELYGIIERTIIEKAEMLKSGDATAVPSAPNGYCTWCEMKPICRVGTK